MASGSPKTDRSAQTPFLLRLYYKQNTLHSSSDFSIHNPSPPQHVQIYTWPNATLSELSHLLTSALPNLLPSPSVGTRLVFRLIYPDARDVPRPGQAGRWVIKEAGSVVIGETSNGMEGVDVDKTLADARFVIGDCVAVSIFPPNSNGEIISMSSAMSGGGLRDFSMGRPAAVPRGGGRMRDGGAFGGGVPPGDWRRGDLPPASSGGGGGYGRRGPRGRGY